MFSGFGRPIIGPIGGGIGDGTGDVVGPGSSTENAIPVFADTSGNLLKETLLLVRETDHLITRSDDSDPGALIGFKTADTGTSQGIVFALSNAADILEVRGEDSKALVRIAGGAVGTIALTELHSSADRVLIQPGVLTDDRTLTTPDASGTVALVETFAAPPAIGNTTPNTGAFTTLNYIRPVINFDANGNLACTAANSNAIVTNFDGPSPTQIVLVSPFTGGCILTFSATNGDFRAIEVIAEIADWDNPGDVFISATVEWGSSLTLAVSSGGVCTVLAANGNVTFNPPPP